MQELKLSMKSGELSFVREMFERIAPHYDFLNRLLSLRRDVVWRRAMVGALNLHSQSLVLDAACGTADVMMEILRRPARQVSVVGIDFAPRMLYLAHAKLSAAQGTGSDVRLAAADMHDLPFGPGCFEAVTMAFGIRNVQDKPAVMRQMYAHLKPGGRLVILELTAPVGGILRCLYMFYFRRLLPLVGRLFSRHHYAYSYLPESVARFPQPAAFARAMGQAGFVNVRYRLLTLGVCSLFAGDKPIASEWKSR